jgi:hypothetical protein
MPRYFSPLDTDYLRLGQAAALLAREREQCTPADIMDLFKRALFSGEFDAPPLGAGEARNHPSNWLHMEIEAPRCSVPPSHARLKPRPKQLYGVNRGTVASVLLTTEVLPGDHAEWERVFDVGEGDYGQENGFYAIAAIPFRDFPEHGRQELEAIIAAKAKLALWFERCGQPLPAFLARPAKKLRGSDAKNGSRSSSGEVPGVRPSGRPQKSAWPRIVRLVRELANEHPIGRRSGLRSRPGAAQKRSSAGTICRRSRPSSAAWSKSWTPALDSVAAGTSFVTDRP